MANQIDLIDKAIVDDWMSDPSQTVVNLITKHIPKAKKHLGACTRRFNAIMRKPEVSMYRDQQIAMLQKQVDIDQSDATRFLAGTLNTNIADFLESSGRGTLKVKDLTELDRNLTAQVKKIKIKETVYTAKNGTETVNTTTEFELYDKMQAIDRLGLLLKWVEQHAGGLNMLGVIVVPEGSTKEEQWKQYQQIPDQTLLPEGTTYIPAGDK